MKEYSHNKKHTGDPKAFDKLEATIKQAAESNEKLRFEYERESLNLRLAALVYKLRTDAGMTQSDLAKKVGIPQSFIARLENPDASKKPTIDTLAKVAQVFDKQIMIEIV